MVSEMNPVVIPEFPRLRGEEAIGALSDFMYELEEQRGKDLTDKQTDALIRVTKGLISSIEAEIRSSTSDRDIKEARFVTHLKQTITKYIPESVSQALRFA